MCWKVKDEVTEETSPSICILPKLVTLGHWESTRLVLSFEDVLARGEKILWFIQVWKRTAALTLEQRL